ncbi:hypothetical protein AB0368_15900 [Actinoplanes sp. NPDC051475]|uniref:hypothetical protein n=1 Tax=Actinoplanes sp. NPDC051475 TaxID=3157225 RepID=UPI00344C6238
MPSAEAEAARNLLFRTLGAHRAAISALKPGAPSRLRVSLDDDPVQDRCQATLVRLLSITESFASEMLSREIEGAMAQARSQTAAKVADEAIIRATSTWKDQQKAYKDWLGVTEDWKAVERLAEARNAVAHGLGNLTRRQLRTEASVRAKLREAGISLQANRIVLSDENLAAATSACCDFIERLDRAVQARPA